MPIHYSDGFLLKKKFDEYLRESERISRFKYRFKQRTNKVKYIECI